MVLVDKLCGEGLGDLVYPKLDILPVITLPGDLGGSIGPKHSGVGEEVDPEEILDDLRLDCELGTNSSVSSSVISIGRESGAGLGRLLLFLQVCRSGVLGCQYKTKPDEYKLN